ncbi:MAG: TetR/AcrR family transcriptional regulator [Dongiaceae bacterium]
MTPNDLNEAGPSRQSLTAQDWAAAALDAMAVGGVDAVAVEPLARRLNVTKGSFYWHFPNREALIKAALALWEQRETVDVVSGLDQEPDPYQRIVNLFKRANSSYKAGRLYLALAAATDDVRVNEVVQRVSARRLAYLEKCYRALGMGAEEAPLWATFAYATFIGNQQVHRDSPRSFPAGPKFREYFKLMLKTLIPRGRADARSAPAMTPLHKTAAGGRT